MTVSYSGFVNGETAASLTSLPTATTLPADSPVGSYAIEITGGASNNYVLMDDPDTLTITPAPLLITADGQTIFTGAAFPALTVSYNGLVNGDTPGTFNAAPNIAPYVTTDATADSPVGTVADIDPGFAYNPNYDISYAAGTFTVNSDSNLSTTTTLGTSAPSTYGQSVTLTATVTAGVETPTGNVEFDKGSTMLGVAPLNGGTATLQVSTLLARSDTTRQARPRSRPPST